MEEPIYCSIIKVNQERRIGGDFEVSLGEVFAREYIILADVDMTVMYIRRVSVLLLWHGTMRMSVLRKSLSLDCSR